MRGALLVCIACALLVSVVRCTARMAAAAPPAPVGTKVVGGDRVLAPDLSAPVVPRGDPEVMFDPESNPFGVVSQIARALVRGDWRLALVVFLCAAVSVLRKLKARWSFLSSDMGGALLAFATASSGVLGLRALAGSGFTWSSITVALLGGMAAMGGYAGLWVRFLRPLWRKLKGDSTDWDARVKPVKVSA